jgi:hypothetical protein
MDEEKLQLIRRFLTQIVKKGYFSLVVGGRGYALGCKADVEPIIEAIRKANPEVQEYRHRQAAHYLGP